MTHTLAPLLMLCVGAAHGSEPEDASIPQTFRDALRDGGHGPRMVAIPPGRFRMGCDRGDVKPYPCTRDKSPAREVYIARPFALSQYEITFDDYDHYLQTKSGDRHDEAHDQSWGRGRRPVVNVTWRDAIGYAEWLSAQTGERYRLPSEAEWQYAARAGSDTLWPWGDEMLPNRANCMGCGSAWDGEGTAPVGSFPANAWGLHDMLGNVYEMLLDCYHIGYKGAPTDGSPRTEPGRGWIRFQRRLGGVDEVFRHRLGGRDENRDCAGQVVRGLSWSSPARSLTLYARGIVRTGEYGAVFGFRVVRENLPNTIEWRADDRASRN